MSMRTTLFHLTKMEFGAQRSVAVLLAISLTVAFCSVLQAVSRPLVFDEICTVLVSRLPNAAGIWNALDDSVDTNPPVFYLVARATRQVISEDHLGYRLPSIVGLLGVIFCVYLILSRTVHRLSALVGAAFVLCTPVVGFASQARPYALMLCCISGAILAWQCIDDSRLYSIVLAVALASAVSLHYYAILVWPAFLLAETSVWIFRRRFRVGAWLPVLFGAVPLLFFAPLLLKTRQYYGQNFWAKPSLTQALFAHDWLFSLGDYWGLMFAAGITVILLYFVITKTATTAEAQHREIDVNGPPSEELILTLVLLWFPVIAVGAAKVGHGGMTERYMLPTVLGGALALGYVIDKTLPAARSLLLLLLLMNYVLASGGIVKNALNGSLLRERKGMIHAAEMIVAELHEPELPIVISNGHQYLVMAYYTPSDLNRRFYAIADPRAAVIFKKGRSDSVDLALLALRRYFPLQTEDFDGFVSKHREFIIVSGGQDWWLERLAHDGFALKLISAGENKIYEAIGRP